MKKKMMITGSVLALCTLGSLGVAYASTNSGSAKSSAHQKFFSNNGNTGKTGIVVGINGQKISFSDALAKELGIDSATLKKDLQSGQSPVQIAQSKGISETTLISDLEANFKSQLDQAVTSGKLTSDMEGQILTKLDSHITQMVESTGGQKLFISKNGNGSGANEAGAVVDINGTKLAFPEVITSVLGIDSATLKTDLQNGQSLVEIAQSKGISESTLVSDLQSSLKAQLDQAVSNGKMTSDMESNILTKLETNITQMVETAGGASVKIANSNA